MNSGPRVSIAMATYNGAKYIREQLDSLTAQTLRPIELVVTDDGSTDATLEILEEFSRTAPFEVRIFRNTERLGYADNFLLAVSHCRGQLIAFCDQDDIWLAQKLEICVAPFRNEGVYISVHNGIVIDEHGEVIPDQILRPNKRRIDRIEKRYWIIYMGHAMVFRNQDIFRDREGGALRPFRDFELSHDAFILFLCLIAGKFAAIPQVLVEYRRHGQNASFQKLTKNRFRETGINKMHGQMDPRLKASVLYENYVALRKRYLMAHQLGWSSDELRSERLTPPLRYARHLRARLAIYNNRLTIRGKLKQTWLNIKLGAYSDSKYWGLGVRALARDIAIVILNFKRPWFRSDDLRNKTC